MQVDVPASQYLLQFSQDALFTQHTLQVEEDAFQIPLQVDTFVQAAELALQFQHLLITQKYPLKKLIFNKHLMFFLKNI